MSRGVRKAAVYQDDVDRSEFLRLLWVVTERYRWECYADCLMTNHFHVVVQTIEPTLSRGMQWLNARYAVWFNERYGLEGHAFERRFNSVLIKNQEHFVVAVQYVVLNPVRAGICGSPGEWRWSSFLATAGVVRPRLCLTVDWLTGHFGGDQREAARRFVQCVEGPDASRQVRALTPDVAPWASRRVVRLRR